MLDINLSPDQLEHLLTQFLRDISGILEQVTVSCSIGAYRFVFPQEIKHLLTETDRVLYQAKENGRACFVRLKSKLQKPAQRKAAVRVFVSVR